MNFSLRKKIILFVLSLLIIITAIAATISTFEIQKYFKHRLFTQMATQIDQAAYLLSTLNPDFENAGDYSFFVAYSLQTSYRITFIDSSGKVVFDSDVPQYALDSLDNHLPRPEVQMALRQDIGQNQRFSATLKKSMFYAAQKSDDYEKIKFIRLAMPLDEIEIALKIIRWKIMLAGGIAFLIISFVSYLIAVRITYPIHQLAQVANKIKAGDFSERFTSSGDDEIAILADLLNEILEKLNNDLVHMKKLERMRSQFLGNVSHELRTPIFSVQGYLETLMQNPDADPQKQRKFTKKAYKQAVRLNNLLTDLIDISRIESGEMKMVFHQFDVHKWLQKIITETKESAGDQNVSIILTNKISENILAIGDQERLKQVMHNIITNAIKYNVEGGRVTLSYSVFEKSVEIVVSDTGRGIEKTHIPHIFERFYRVDKERSRNVGGTGLGLAIVKHILEAHNSKITVESEIGIGSRFSFSLTKAQISHF